MAKPRTPVPEDTAALVLFRSDRICCVCRESNKALQIHHIDEDPTNHDPENLAVLCLECHDKTQVRGGFGRPLTAAQILFYRKDWLHTVEARRALGMPASAAPSPAPPDAAQRLAHDRDVFFKAREVMAETGLERALDRMWNADEYKRSEYVPVRVFARFLQAADHEFCPGSA